MQGFWLFGGSFSYSRRNSYVIQIFPIDLEATCPTVKWTDVIPFSCAVTGFLPVKKLLWKFTFSIFMHSFDKRSSCPHVTLLWKQTQFKRTFAIMEKYDPVFTVDYWFDENIWDEMPYEQAGFGLDLIAWATSHTKDVYLLKNSLSGNASRLRSENCQSGLWSFQLKPERQTLQNTPSNSRTSKHWGALSSTWRSYKII